MAKQDITTALPPTCKPIVPTPETKTQDVLSRWSDAHVSLPYAIVTPTSTEDIVSTIHFAQSHSLKIVPAAGANGSFIPITSRTIYLDMTSFNKVHLDASRGEVTIGGGATTGTVLQHLAERGWHTVLTNSNAVGVVGAFLGGMSGAVNGIKGFGIDHVTSVTMAIFDAGQAPDWRVLCGAGHGMGVVTSLTLRAWRVDELGLTDGKVWTRKLMFPARAVAEVAELYLALQPPARELTAVMVFLRAPPTAPVPDAPMILLSLSYFGSEGSARRMCVKTYEERYTRKAIMNVTALTKMEDLNAANEPLSARGGFKEYYGCFLEEVSMESIVKSFEEWQKFTAADLKDRGKSFVVIGSWSTDVLVKNEGALGYKTYFNARGRGTFVQATVWYDKWDAKEEADSFGSALVGYLRKEDRQAGRKDFCFANNMIAGHNIYEIYTEEQTRYETGKRYI
ncbi:FAD-binding domain-containing protein [Lojkania enalia]|uniref:FAD-binding domain-containing protein n=1 Tax=Lojkania enalia TaxID=147567 RepID=A0A9P4KEI3_9PLEO|nr:FAD-binding domain-containing protein [Didymosphaeria enalia]